jgi:PEGA domain
MAISRDESTISTVSSSDLKIDAGPHRVEIRLDGYETLTFDVRIDPDRTTTYAGELKKVP